MVIGSGIAPIDFNTGFVNGPNAAPQKGGNVQAETGGVQEQSFAGVVSSLGNDFAQTIEKAESTSLAGIKGEATAYEVASSVMEAEQMLRMTVAVRDKMVQAYLEISRMQI